MTLRTLSLALVTVPARLVIWSVRWAALLFFPFRLGRLLETVSVPRIAEHPWRTTLTTLGIALGVAVLVAVTIVNRSISIGVKQALGDLTGKVDLEIGSGTGGLDEALADTIRRVPGVAKLSPMMQQVVSVEAGGGRRERLLLLGIDLLDGDDAYFSNYPSPQLKAIRRDPLAFLNSSTNLILGRRMAERLGIRVHDKVSITTSSGVQAFDVWGFIEEDGVGRAAGGAIGVMYYPAMQVAFDRGHNVDRIDIEVAPGHDSVQVAQALRALLGPAVSVEAPALRGERLGKTFAALNAGLTMASVIALMAGGVLVFTTLSISIVQRKAELALLRALGSTRGQLQRLLALEGTLLGVVGSAIGIALGIAMSRGMLELTAAAISQDDVRQSVSKVHVDARVIALGLTLGTVTALAAALVAARRTLFETRAAPGEGGSWLALSDRVGVGLLIATVVLLALPPLGDVPLGPICAYGSVTLGICALMPRFVQWLHTGSLGLLQRLFGVETVLASGNMMRDLRRTASTSSTVMISTALTIASATFAASLVASIETWSAQLAHGDLFVMSGAPMGRMSGRNTPLAEALQSELLSVPGVARIGRSRFVDIDYKGTVVKLSSTDVALMHERAPLIAVTGDAGEIARALIAGDVAISESFASATHVKPGDRIALATKDGTRDFRVAGIVVDYASDAGTILMDRATYVAAWGDSRVDVFELHLAPGADAQAVRRQIDERFGDRHDLFVFTNREFRDEFVKSAGSTFSLMRTLELVTLLVAAMGLVTTIAASVSDRIREIGVLRAVGMRRAQVQKMIVWEATFVGGVGALVGICLGAACGYFLLNRILNVQLGLYMPFHLPLRSVLEVACVALLVSALAGLYPARQAAALPIVAATKYE